jgi:transcriptional regulator with XRE-family HTH domain
VIGEAVRLLRIYHDMSQTALSSALKLSNSYVSELESGKKQPTLEVLEKYADYFQIPVSSLLLFSEQLGKKGAAESVRKGVAKKILSMLSWVAEKNAQSSREKRKPA